MGKSVSFTRTWVGLGLAAGLFLGCQHFLGQEDRPASPVGDTSSDPPAEMALRMTMKQTSECRTLRDKVLAADAAGAATVTLQTDFIRKCIEEAESADSAGKVVFPSDLLPDGHTPCRWLVSGVDRGSKELVIKFRYYCPDECDTHASGESALHARICRDPVPGCAVLKAKLAYMDPKSEGYARLRLHLAEHCGAPDTPRPPNDTPKPPKPALPITAVLLCDSLRESLAGLDPSTEEYGTAKHAWYSQCLETKPYNDPTICGHLMSRLKGMDTTSREYPLLKHEIALRCPDLVPKEPAKPSYPQPISPECADLQKQMAQPGLPHEEYSRLKQLYSEKCFH